MNLLIYVFSASLILAQAFDVIPTPESIVEEITQDTVLDDSNVPTNYSRNGYDAIIDDVSKKVVGFSFTNTGINRIVPKKSQIGMGPDRTFSIEMPERARQDISLHITDAPTDKLSQLMESHFMIFPRLVVPAILVDGIYTKVTLPNREEVIFSTESKEIISGVLKEGAAIDLGPDRFKRKFADVVYTGKGIFLRVDRRGEDPRLGAQIATIFYHDIKCKVPVSQLWDQKKSLHFLYPIDADFFVFVKKTCGFQITPNLN